MVINVLVMIHGMIPVSSRFSSGDEAETHFDEYSSFWESIKQEKPELETLFASGFSHEDGEQNLNFIGVEWGEDPENGAEITENHQLLTKAQEFVNKRVAYKNLKSLNEPNNVILKPLDFPNHPLALARNILVGLREDIVTAGFGDVIYYSSEEGEKEVRRTVYGQVLEQLDRFLDEPEVRLHLIGQSLGVTITHDFLYGLFNKKGEGDFVCEHQGTKESERRYKLWREKADIGELKLGSLTSTASQLPLFVMRSKELVERLANEKTIEAANIGISDTNKVQWQLFYDVDDILGFASRRLYDSENAIKDIQVDSSDDPSKAHTKYWENETVIKETAKLLLANAR